MHDATSPTTLTRTWPTKLAAFGAVTFLLVTFFVIAVRPWHRSWGATVWEERRALPGDEIVSSPRASGGNTHAITIHAPASEVWAWLAQLGQDRGGFYSYEILEDLAGCEMENADRRHPEFQHWAVGDKLWMYPPHKLDGLGHAVLMRFESGRALGFGTKRPGTPLSAPPDGSW